LSGKEFQTDGAATANARLATVCVYVFEEVSPSGRSKTSVTTLCDDNEEQ